MNRVNLLDGFQLDNDKPSTSEFDEQAFAINGFQQSGTNGAVHFDRATNDPVTYQFDILRLPV